MDNERPGKPPAPIAYLGGSQIRHHVSLPERLRYAVLFIGRFRFIRPCVGSINGRRYAGVV